MNILGYKIGAPVMLQLGGFQFGINTAAFQSLQRNNEWRWPAQDRFGKPPVLQFIGEGAESITLPGVIYPEWRGGFGQLDAMRAQAGKGEPLLMVDGQGRMMGKWAIERIEEKQSVFADAGAPRKQEFTIQLRRFHETKPADDPAPIIEQAAAAAESAAGAAIPEGAQGAVSQAAGLANSVASAAKSMAATVSKAYQDVQAAVAPYAAMAADAAGGVMRCAEVASELQTTANRVLAVVGKSPINITAISAAQSMASKANGLLVSANSAGALLRNTTAKMEQLANVPAKAVQAVRSAAATAEKCADLCRQTASEASKIKE